MSKVEMTFQVTKVMHASNPAEQWLEAVQSEGPWANPMYKGCKLILTVIDDDTLRQYGTGKLLGLTWET